MPFSWFSHREWRTKARMFEPLPGWWRKLRGGGAGEFDGSVDHDPEWRDLLVRYILRFTVAFVMLFGAVFLAFRWSGAAVRFGAERVSGNAVPTWRVRGVVRDAQIRADGLRCFLRRQTCRADSR